MSGGGGGGGEGKEGVGGVVTVYFSYFSMKTFVACTPQKCIDEVLLRSALSTYKVCFCGEIRKKSLLFR